MCRCSRPVLGHQIIAEMSGRVPLQVTSYSISERATCELMHLLKDGPEEPLSAQLASWGRRSLCSQPTPQRFGQGLLPPPAAPPFWGAQCSSLGTPLRPGGGCRWGARSHSHPRGGDATLPPAPSGQQDSAIRSMHPIQHLKYLKTKGTECTEPPAGPRDIAGASKLPGLVLV